MGYPGIELDIRLTADNQLVVFHDANGQRLLGKDMNIEDLELSQITIHKLVSDKNTQAGPVSLDSVFAEFGNTFSYYLDIKEPNFRVAREVHRLITKYQLLKHAWIASTDPMFLGYLKTRNSLLITVQEEFNPGKEWLYQLIPKKFKADFYSGSFVYINDEHLQFLSKHNLMNRRIVFDINRQNMQSALDRGFRKIILDRDTGDHIMPR